MVPPITDFALKDPYTYLHGFGNYHSSEAFPGANPLVNNSPQKPPYGLRTERISGSAFTAPRNENLQTWMYRQNSSLDHTEFVAYDEQQKAEVPKYLTPNSYMWPQFDLDSKRDWTDQKLIGQTGNPVSKTGLAIWLFNLSKSMPERTAFSSLDGDALIIPQSGALDIQTELGKLLVRQNEIAVIPRGIRYRVTLPMGHARGYVCELFQGHFQLPELGPVGSTGLANVRDFEIPTAIFDGAVGEDGIARASEGEREWTILSRLNGRLWRCEQDHTPFDIAAWHGTNYPYKYDLAKFCVMGNLLFDEHDPSLYVVLTAPSPIPGTSVADFAIIPPRWMASEDTFWLPYYHRNTMSEFYAPIVYDQSPSSPLNHGEGFRPFGAGLNGSMACHGPTEAEFEKARAVDTRKPAKTMMEGVTLFLLETDTPLFLTDWAFESAQKNFKAKPKGAAKM